MFKRARRGTRFRTKTPAEKKAAPRASVWMMSREKEGTDLSPGE
jgi:hypothetical protein